MRVSASKFETVVLRSERWNIPFRFGYDVASFREVCTSWGLYICERAKKASLFVCQWSFVQNLSYDHKLWLVAERKRLQIQAAGMSFLHRVAGLHLWKEDEKLFIIELLVLHIEMSQLRWFEHLVRMPPGRLPEDMFWICQSRHSSQNKPRTRRRDFRHY